jgi:hypothetical protein
MSVSLPITIIEQTRCEVGDVPIAEKNRRAAASDPWTFSIDVRYSGTDRLRIPLPARAEQTESTEAACEERKCAGERCGADVND